MIETPCALNPIDRSIYRVEPSENTETAKNKASENRVSHELRGRNRARYVLSHVSTYNDWQSRRDRGAHDPLRQFPDAQRDGTEDISSKYLSIQLRGNRSAPTRIPEKISERPPLQISSISFPPETIKLLRRRIVAMLMTQSSLPPDSGIGLN